MSEIVASFTNVGVPATGLSPTIRIRRTDTQALVVTDAAMVEQGDGNYSYDFTPTDGLEYAIRADGGAGLPINERYVFGSLSGTTEARIETDIPTIAADVWDVDLTGHQVADSAGYELSQILDIGKNRLYVDFGVSPAQLVLRNRANDADLLRWNLETEGGEAVETLPGVQTKRGVPA